MPKFQVVPIVTMCIVMIVVMIESTGMFLALSEMTGRRMDQAAIARGLRADGVGTILGGIFNTFPYTSFSQNVGLVGVTDHGDVGERSPLRQGHYPLENQLYAIARKSRSVAGDTPSAAVRRTSFSRATSALIGTGAYAIQRTKTRHNASPSIWCCRDHTTGASNRRAAPMPCGNRPSTAAVTRLGARKAREIVMVT